MKKLKLLILFLFLSASVFAQKYYTKTGTTEFRASVKAFEPVAARNNSTSAVLDSKTGNIAALLFINAFHFKVGLMQEHFNENYMDSNRHPKAVFRGKIEPVSISTEVLAYKKNINLSKEHSQIRGVKERN